MTIDEAFEVFRTETASIPAAAVIYPTLEEFAINVAEAGGQLSREASLEFVRQCRQAIVESVPPDDLDANKTAARVADFVGWKLAKILSKVNGGMAPLHEGPVPRRPKTKTVSDE